MRKMPEAARQITLNMEQVIPKVIWEEHVATPHGRECICLLRALLAAQCSLQTSPVTQLRVCYIHTTVHMHPICNNALSNILPAKKCPFPNLRY